MYIVKHRPHIKVKLRLTIINETSDQNMRVYCGGTRVTITPCLGFTTNESLRLTNTLSICRERKTALYRLETDRLKKEISLLIQRLVKKKHAMYNPGIVYEVYICCLRRRIPVISSDKVPSVIAVIITTHAVTTKHQAIFSRCHRRQGKIAGLKPAAHEPCGRSHCVSHAHSSVSSPPLATVCCHLVAVLQGLYS